MTAPSAPRGLLRAEILSIGSELTVGETRDTNAGELARSLTDLGARVERLVGLPDTLETVEEAFAAGLDRADLLVCTGGLGPTPDDLTREAIAAACGETPAIDPGLQHWLEDLFERRGIAFPASNLKQAWLIPSATAVPNPNGTAPGWWVDRPDGRVIVALPGPPREMRPMWREWVVPRLRRRGIGERRLTRTYRLTGIGESLVAQAIGEPLLRAENPQVATYARVEAVDVRISAADQPASPDAPARAAEEIFGEADAHVLAAIGRYVWGRDQDTWASVIGDRLQAAGHRLSVIEVGTGGSVAGLFGDVPWLERLEMRGGPVDEDTIDPEGLATEARRAGGNPDRTVGLGVVARPTSQDTLVTVAVDAPDRRHEEERTVFLGGEQGRARAALGAAAILFATLDDRLDQPDPASLERR